LRQSFSGGLSDFDAVQKTYHRMSKNGPAHWPCSFHHPFFTAQWRERFADTWPFTQETNCWKVLRIPVLISWLHASRRAGQTDQVFHQHGFDADVACSRPLDEPHPSYPVDGNELLPTLTQMRLWSARKLVLSLQLIPARAALDCDYKFLRSATILSSSSEGWRTRSNAPT